MPKRKRSYTRKAKKTYRARTARRRTKRRKGSHFVFSHNDVKGGYSRVKHTGNERFKARKGGLKVKTTPMKSVVHPTLHKVFELVHPGFRNKNLPVRLNAQQQSHVRDLGKHVVDGTLTNVHGNMKSSYTPSELVKYIKGLVGYGSQTTPGSNQIAVRSTKSVHNPWSYGFMREMAPHFKGVGNSIVRSLKANYPFDAATHNAAVSKVHLGTKALAAVNLGQGVLQQNPNQIVTNAVLNPFIDYIFNQAYMEETKPKTILQK